MGPMPMVLVEPTLLLSVASFAFQVGSSPSLNGGKGRLSTTCDGTPASGVHHPIAQGRIAPPISLVRVGSLGKQCPCDLHMTEPGGLMERASIRIICRQYRI